MDALRQFLQRHIPDASWRSLLDTRLQKTDRLVQEGYWLPCRDLAPLIANGLHPAMTTTPLAMATTLVYLGADLLDDLQDQELDAQWQQLPVAQVTMIAATLASALPALAIDELHIYGATKAQLHATLARGLCAMSFGQFQDLEMKGADLVPLFQVKQSLEGKSGAECALFCLMGAQCAGASPSDFPHYATLGRALGTAMQLASDLHELLWKPYSPDLYEQVRSLPIAFCLHVLSGAPREDFLQHLRVAGTDAAAREQVLAMLQQSGSIGYATLVIEQYCQQARDALTHLPLTESSTMQIVERIQSISLLHLEPTGDNREEAYESAERSDHAVGERRAIS